MRLRELVTIKTKKASVKETVITITMFFACLIIAGIIFML